MDRVAEKVADGKVLSLVEGMLQAGVMDTVEGWQANKQGSPQGAVISPLLSNIYLNGLDWKMARVCRATLFRGNGVGSTAHYFVGTGAWGTG